MISFEIVYWQDTNGSSPFRKWYERLDAVAALKVYEALIRMECGNFSDSKLLSNGIRERRIHSGPGYRLYYGIDRQRRVVVLLGGTKRTQEGDIRKAEKLWHEYQTRSD